MNNYDFVPKLDIEGNKLETIEELKMFGLVLSNNPSWKQNTDAMVKKHSRGCG